MGERQWKGTKSLRKKINSHVTVNVPPRRDRGVESVRQVQAYADHCPTDLPRY